MKFTAIILLSACITASANGYSQAVTISEKNAPIEKVFSAIEKQTGYTFFYQEELIQKAKKIDISVTNVSLQEVLKLVFKDQPLTYSIVEKTIVVKEKRPTEIAIPESLPPIDVRGRVVNEKGEPVVGASVQVKGNKNLGTSTDDNGYFELKGVDENATLVISAVNIETFEVKVAGKADLATLGAKTKVTTGETVTIEANTGYQKVKPNEVTGSLNVVDNKLFNRVVTTNVLERLDGIVPGLIFNRRIGTSNPTDISIRGISTIESDQRPLIVVDNFPYEGDINNINPNEVENITILKDAAATSIWGTRAGNGVIVITTKKGKYNQKTRISVNSNTTIIDKPDLFYNPQFPALDFIGIESFLFDKGYYDGDLINTSTYPVISPVVEILNKRRMGLITPADSATQINSLLNNDIRKDYTKYLYRSAINLQHSLSLSGGTNNINYLLSVGYDKNISNLVGNNQERITIRTQSNLRPIRNLEIQYNSIITLNRSENNSPGVPLLAGGGKGYLYPYARLIDDNGNHLAVEKEYRSLFKDTAGNGNLLNWDYKPLDELNFADNTGKSTDILINFGGKYNFTNWLSTEIMYQFEKTISSSRNYYSPETFSTRNFINQFTAPGNSYINSAIPFGGILDNTGGELRSNAIRGQLNIDKAWLQNHRFSAIIGSEIREAHSIFNKTVIYGYDGETATYKNVDYLNQYPLYFGGSTSIPNNSYTSDKLNRFVSFYGNASYIFKSRYTISASGRRDASNLFGTSTNNKWKPLWSFGLGWDVSRESFYNLKSIPYLKIRTTYGYSGNVNNTNPALLTLSAFPYANQFTNLTQYLINNPPNPTLRWENNRMINVGIDFEVKNKIITGSIEYYTKKSTDLISRVAADITSGYTSLVLNSATLDGKGLDISLNTKNWDRKYLKWTTNWIFSYNTNKVAKYLLDNTAKDYIASPITPLVGQNAYSVISRRWGGLDATNGDPQGYVNGQLSSDYNLIAASTNSSDYIIHGSSRPEIFGAFRNTISIGNLSLSANITYRFKYYFRRNNLIRYSGLFGFWDQSGYTDYLKRWQKPGDEAFTNVPSLIYPSNSNRDNFYNESEVTVERGDHIRFQDISVSYSVNNNVWKKNPFDLVTFYLYINNLGVLWKATDFKIDPDYGIPPSRSYSLGVKIDL